MRRSELVKVVADKTGVKRKTVELVARAYEEAIKEQVCAGEPVVITGLMRLEKETVAERERFIPATRQLEVVPAHDVIKVTISRSLKEKVK